MYRVRMPPSGKYVNFLYLISELLRHYHGYRYWNQTATLWQPWKSTPESNKNDITHIPGRKFLATPLWLTMYSEALVFRLQSTCQKFFRDNTTADDSCGWVNLVKKRDRLLLLHGAACPWEWVISESRLRASVGTTCADCSHERWNCKAKAMSCPRHALASDPSAETRSSNSSRKKNSSASENVIDFLIYSKPPTSMLNISFNLCHVKYSMFRLFCRKCQKRFWFLLTERFFVV